jgi:hypothetical protein
VAITYSGPRNPKIDVDDDMNSGLTTCWDRPCRRGNVTCAPRLDVHTQIHLYGMS